MTVEGFAVGLGSLDSTGAAGCAKPQLASST